MIDEKKLINNLTIRREKLRYISIVALHNNMNYVDTIINEINSIIDIINEQPKVGEWIPCSERLPENAKHKGAFCPKYQVKTKYGLTQGWYNPDTESWYCLFWFLVGRYDETDIDFEKGDKPKVVRILDGTGEVLAWKEPSEPWEGGKE